MLAVSKEEQGVAQIRRLTADRMKRERGLLSGATRTVWDTADVFFLFVSLFLFTPTSTSKKTGSLVAEASPSSGGKMPKGEKGLPMGCFGALSGQ